MNRLVSDADNVSTVAAETVTQLLSSLLMVAGALAFHGGPQPAAHSDGPGNCAGDRPVHPPDLPAEQDALPPAGR